MTLAAAALLTPGRGRVRRDVRAELGGHPAQDAAEDLAGIRLIGSGHGPVRQASAARPRVTPGKAADCSDTPDLIRDNDPLSLIDRIPSCGNGGWAGPRLPPVIREASEAARTVASRSRRSR